MPEKKSLSQNKRSEIRADRGYRNFVATFHGLAELLWPHTASGQLELPEGGCVICPNHISFADIPVIACVFRGRLLKYMAKKELFFWPLGVLFRALGAYAVDRRNGDVGAIKTAISLCEKGYAAVIFPQGHRNPGVDPKETKVHGGAMLVAKKANVPIIPVYIKTKDRRVRFFRKIEVCVAPPVYPESFGEYGESNGEAMKELFIRACKMEETGKWS